MREGGSLTVKKEAAIILLVRTTYTGMARAGKMRFGCEGNNEGSDCSCRSYRTPPPGPTFKAR